MGRPAGPTLPKPTKPEPELRKFYFDLIISFVCKNSNNNLLNV